MVVGGCSYINLHMLTLPDNPKAYSASSDFDVLFSFISFDFNLTLQHKVVGLVGSVHGRVPASLLDFLFSDSSGLRRMLPT